MNVSLNDIRKWIYIVEKLYRNTKEYQTENIRRYLVNFKKENKK